MSVDIELARKYALVYLPVDSLDVTNKSFNTMRDAPVQSACHLLAQVQAIHLTGAMDNKEYQICATNGFMAGFALAYAMSRGLQMNGILKEQLEKAAKLRGENVVTLLERKKTIV